MRTPLKTARAETEQSENSSNCPENHDLLQDFVAHSDANYSSDRNCSSISPEEYDKIAYEFINSKIEEDKRSDYPLKNKLRLEDILRRIGDIENKDDLNKIVDALAANNNLDLNYLFNALSKRESRNIFRRERFKPSEYWEDRKKPLKETPVDFINRVYGSVLDGYFTQADLKGHDPKLVTALYNWMRFHNQPRPPLSELNLPTKPALNTQLIESGAELWQLPQARLEQVKATRKTRANAGSDISPT